MMKTGNKISGGIRKVLKANRGSSALMSYGEIIEKRRLQAKRSILVFAGRTDKDRRSELELQIQRWSNLNNMDTIKTFHFKNSSFLVELPSVSYISLLLNNGAKHFKNVERNVPCRTRLLYLTGKSNHLSDRDTRNNEKMVKDFKLQQLLVSASSFSTQMAELCNHLKQTECGVRLRFFLASYIEDVFSGLFPHMYCRLYGSSVNGFGTDHSDLDLSIVLDHKINESSESMDPPFLYRTKMKSCDERVFAKKTLDLFAEYLQIFVPCITNTTKILHARVPIVKFEQTDSEIGCDLSMGNDSGCLMSEILWNYSRFDERVRPLVFAVRRWAAVMNLTSGFSTKFSTGFTNFHLMSLIVFFLEYSKPPVIPSIGSMVNTALSSEARQIISVGPKTTISPKNTANMEDLLAEFFQFYARFDFRSRAINLESGETYPKPDHFPIYVANPLEKGHNITKNVGEDYLERFVACCRGALWLMTSDSGKGGRKDEEWGLLRILNPANYSAGQGREINLKVNSIFEEESVVEKEKISGDSQETNVENTGFVGL